MPIAFKTPISLTATQYRESYVAGEDLIWEGVKTNDPVVRITGDFKSKVRMDGFIPPLTLDANGSGGVILDRLVFSNVPSIQVIDFVGTAIDAISSRQVRYGELTALNGNPIGGSPAIAFRSASNEQGDGTNSVRIGSVEVGNCNHTRMFSIVGGGRDNLGTAKNIDIEYVWLQFAWDQLDKYPLKGREWIYMEKCLQVKVRDSLLVLDPGQTHSPVRMESCKSCSVSGSMRMKGEKTPPSSITKGNTVNFIFNEQDAP